MKATSVEVELSWERGCDTCGGLMRAGTRVVRIRWNGGYSYHHKPCGAQDMKAMEDWN